MENNTPQDSEGPVQRLRILLLQAQALRPNQQADAHILFWKATGLLLVHAPKELQDIYAQIETAVTRIYKGDLLT